MFTLSLSARLAASGRNYFAMLQTWAKPNPASGQGGTWTWELRIVILSAPTAASPTFPSRYSCLNDVSLMFPDYVFRELRLMDVLDDLCDRMKLYSARAGPEFPYIKGGMTWSQQFITENVTLRQNFDCYEISVLSNSFACFLSNLVLIIPTLHRDLVNC